MKIKSQTKLEESELTKEIRQHMQVVRKKLGGIDHHLDQAKKPLEETIDHQVGSLIRHGVETSRRSRGRPVIISRNDRITKVDGDSIRTSKGVELKVVQKVGSRSNIEKHGDWHVIKEESEVNEISTRTLQSYRNDVTVDAIRNHSSKISSKREKGYHLALRKLNRRGERSGLPPLKDEVELHGDGLEEGSFGDAFSAARASGKETFDFGGKSFNTRRSGESDSQWRNSLKPALKAPIPAPRLDRSKISSTAPIPAPRLDRSRPNAGPSGNPANDPKPVVHVAKPNAGPSGNPANDPKPIRPADKLSKVDSYVKKPATKTDTGAINAVQKAADRKRLEIALKNKVASMREEVEVTDIDEGKSWKGGDYRAQLAKKIRTKQQKSETDRAKSKRSIGEEIEEVDEAKLSGHHVTDSTGLEEDSSSTTKNFLKYRNTKNQKSTEDLVKDFHAKGGSIKKGETQPMDSSLRYSKPVKAATVNLAALKDPVAVRNNNIKKARAQRLKGNWASYERGIREDAEKSKEKDHMVNCPSCKGYGKKTDRYDNYDICDDCDGKGKVSAKSLSEKAHAEQVDEKALEQDGVYRAKKVATKKFNNMTGHEHKGITYWNSGNKGSPLSGKHPGKAANGKYRLRVVEELIAKRLDEISKAKATAYRDAATDDFNAMQRARKFAAPDVLKLINHKGKMRVRGIARADDKLGNTDGSYGKVKVKEDAEQVGESSIKMLDKYHDASVDYINRGEDPRKNAKRYIGLDLANRKMFRGKHPYYGAKPVKVKATESYEQVDELSKSTLKSYMDKAENEIKVKETHGMRKASNVALAKHKKRSAGWWQARDKIDGGAKVMAREEVELDEAKQWYQIDKMKSQGKHKQAGRLAALSNLDRNYGAHFGMRSDRAQAMADFHAGYDEAKARMKKSVKEGVELDEISYMKARNYIDAARDEHSTIQKMLRTADEKSANDLKRKGRMRVRGIARAHDKIGATNGTYGKVKVGNLKGDHGKVRYEEVEQVDEAKLIKTHASADGKRVAKVYRDAEWDEYHVKHYTDGKHHSKADYHTDDKDDAHGTAKLFVKEEIELDELSRETLMSYAMAAAKQRRVLGHKKTELYRSSSDGDEIERVRNQHRKRESGYENATDKLDGYARVNASKGKSKIKEDSDIEEGKTFKASEDDGYAVRKNLRDKVKKFTIARREGKTKRQVAEGYPEVQTLNKKKRPSATGSKIEPTGIR